MLLMPDGMITYSSEVIPANEFAEIEVNPLGRTKVLIPLHSANAYSSIVVTDSGSEIVSTSFKPM